MAGLQNAPLSQMERSPRGPRVLLVQSQLPEESDLQRALQRSGFHVTAKWTVREALNTLSESKFDALICDLHLPAAGDGFTLVNAMRHLHPEAVTLIMSNYPSLRESLTQLLPQADEVLVTPMPMEEIVSLLKRRIENPTHRVLRAREPVAVVLERHSSTIIREWLKRVKKSENLTQLRVSDTDRKGHLSVLLGELVQRLQTPHYEEGKAKISFAAIAHGKERKELGYTGAMLVEESRILQVCIFKTLRNNLNAVDLALVLTDVMTIADEVDSQLTQTMRSFSEPHGAGRRVAMRAEA